MAICGPLRQLSPPPWKVRKAQGTLAHVTDGEQAKQLPCSHSRSLLGRAAPVFFPLPCAASAVGPPGVGVLSQAGRTVLYTAAAHRRHSSAWQEMGCHRCPAQAASEATGEATSAGWAAGVRPTPGTPRRLLVFAGARESVRLQGIPEMALPWTGAGGQVSGALAWESQRTGRSQETESQLMISWQSLSGAQRVSDLPALQRRQGSGGSPVGL